MVLPHYGPFHLLGERCGFALFFENPSRSPKDQAWWKFKISYQAKLSRLQQHVLKTKEEMLKQSFISIEPSKYGTRAVLKAPWSDRAHREIMRLRPDELELNTSKGWFGRELDFLEHYEWLKSFEIIDMRIDSIKPISNLKMLQNLKIFTYCNTQLDFRLFKDLRTCAIEWRKGADSVFECTGLTELFINRFHGKSSAPFSKLVNLEKLGILNASIKEVSGLSTLTQLKSIRIGGLRSLKSLEGIESLNQLKRFQMQGCRSVTSIEPLSALICLEDLAITEAGVIDSLEPLRGLSQLRRVIFYGSTNILDGDLNFIFDNQEIASVSFQNRRHYTHTRQQFLQRLSELN